MKTPNPYWTKAGPVAFAVLALALATHWGLLLSASLEEQYGDDWSQMLGFLRWLSGYVLVGAGLAGAAWLNHRGPFRRWAKSAHRWHYRAWLLLLCWSLFEALQWRTEHDIELVDENLLVAVLATLSIAGLTLVFDMAQARRERLELEQQKTAAELDSLRAQLHPHFLFNALNTLFGEALRQGQDRLAERIGELSGLLRFLLQQAQRDTVDIGEEIAFLQRYASLQEARLPANPQRHLHIDFDWDGRPTPIAPLLLMPFIENAFQYGLHPSKPCSLTVSLHVEDGRLRFRAENTVVAPAHPRGAGTGIANTRRRLERLYPRQYQLQIAEAGGLFRVAMDINLKKHADAMNRVSANPNRP